ncbi:T-cell immunoglobulin and mucin domain-containing protein 4 [Echinops telfairi]|uniref:T-cell immunoglobulin and mucin domain-containing protein 4 n=1 Tax=Echinops telfairi TaxID=9371 RepID=UPI001E1D3B26|nr:T-cell immunoglobulin and mucin domain-containing protein 4 [Echinops telfairi]
MSKGSLLLWLLIELGQLYLTQVSSEVVVTAFVGESVLLPCLYPSWSASKNSMCWGKGQCPKSKCNEELLHTDGTHVTAKKSRRYRLQGNLQEGDVSLTISNTDEGDDGVYCCRIEVPGWFNDVKKNIRLKLTRAPPTTQATTLPPPTTAHVITTTRMVTSATAQPTTVVTTPDLTTVTSLQSRTSSVLTTTVTTCTQTPLNPLSEVATDLLRTETFLLSSGSQKSAERTSENPASLTSKDSKVWILQSTPQTSRWKTSQSVTSQLRGLQMTMSDLLIIIIPCIGFVALVLLLGFLLRGKVMRTTCLQKHTRLANTGESKNVLSDIQLGREDEDGMFTL